ncbi:MAG: hypothetical protein U0324_07220 [Polyangiales bacterium]
MARLFNIEVFNQTISGDANAPIYYTSEDHAALLGSADRLVCQLVIMSQKNQSSTVTVQYQHNNTLESELWRDGSAGSVKSIPGPANYTDLPAVLWYAIFADVDRGAFGRFKITSDQEGVTFRLIVTGYSN